MQDELKKRPAKTKPHAAQSILRANGQMLPETKAALDDFYKPLNIMLAETLKDDAFRWDDA